MLLSQFDYDLPPDLIAQEPAPERDASRLLVLDRASGRIEHRAFADFPEYLRPGDVLIINDTRVIPARLFGVYDDGKSVEVLLVRPAGSDGWEVMVKPAKPARVGRRLSLACGHLEATVVTLGIHGRRVVRLPENVNLRAILHSYGVVPLPPYIKRRAASRVPADGGRPRVETETAEAESESRLVARGSWLGSDRERYQTVYAREDGAVAAPTAGLHFTQELLDRIRDLGVHVVPVTLHVGPGTFLPVRTEDLSQHRMEPERYTIPDSTAEAVNAAKRERRRVVAVGTTSVRTLEHAATGRGALPAGSGDADLFITPGFRFRLVDGFLTNFHLPRSTPLILVAALAGLEATRRAYAEAIARRYRFYSYGDAMLIV
jgi:S-adenosylmethionine:tRNA ribosyltransferase-isomerase